jgi:hypothetical protein
MENGRSTVVALSMYSEIVAFRWKNKINNINNIIINRINKSLSRKPVSGNESPTLGRK